MASRPKPIQAGSSDTPHYPALLCAKKACQRTSLAGLIKPGMLSPYARLDLANATLDKYRERGNEMFALSYDEQTVKTTSASLGLRSEYARSTGIGIFTPGLRVEYQHDFQGAGDTALSGKPDACNACVP